MSSVFQPAPIGDNTPPHELPTDGNPKAPSPHEDSATHLPRAAELLPREYRHAAWRRRILRKASIFTVVIAVILVALYVNAYASRWAAENTQTSAQSEIAALDQQLQELQPIITLNSLIQDRQELAQTITRNSQDLGELTSKLADRISQLPYVVSIDSMSATLTSTTERAACAQSSPFDTTLTVGCVDLSLTVSNPQNATRLVRDLEQNEPRLTSGVISSATQSQAGNEGKLRATFAIAAQSPQDMEEQP